jgi:ADP-ribose pyrophosphatase
LKPLKTEVAFATPWIQVMAKTLREGEEPYYTLSLPDYVSILALTEDGRVLVVRQYRQAVERYTLELPSGLVDAGEQPAETARRELREETGYEAGEIEVIGTLSVDTGRLGNVAWACVARGVRPIAGAVIEEGLECFAWTLDEVVQATIEGRFDHSLHIAIVWLAMLKGVLPR